MSKEQVLASSIYALISLPLMVISELLVVYPYQQLITVSYPIISPFTSPLIWRQIAPIWFYNLNDYHLEDDVSLLIYILKGNLFSNGFIMKYNEKQTEKM